MPVITCAQHKYNNRRGRSVGVAIAMEFRGERDHIWTGRNSALSPFLLECILGYACFDFSHNAQTSDIAAERCYCFRNISTFGF